MTNTDPPDQRVAYPSSGSSPAAAGEGSLIVKLISTSTPKYSVQALP